MQEKSIVNALLQIRVETVQAGQDASHVKTKAANLLKAELKRKGVTYAQLVDKLANIGISEKEVNVRNKLSRGKFSAASLLQCLEVIGVQRLHL